MRRLLKVFVLCLIAGLYSCTQLEDAIQIDITHRPDAKVFYGFTPSSDATKTSLDAQAKLYWNTGDMIALFQSATNEQYIFNGEEGSTWSEFVKNDASITGESFSTNYALYPWAESVASAEAGTITFTLPATQPYAVKSFAQNTNPMVAVTTSSSSNELKFQNLCGFVQLRLYGDATVRRIRFYGNNNEVLCGDATVTAAYGSEPVLALSGEGGKVITLDCGEGGISLGATAAEYTPVWLVIPPVAFTQGFTIEIERLSGVVSTKSTDKSVTISRNHVLPISAFEVEQAPKRIKAFSLSDGTHTYTAFDITDDVISVQVSNGTDMTSMSATFECEGESVSVGAVVQESGVTTNDFSDFTNPVEYVVTASDASTRTYIIRMFDLPVVTVETPGHVGITDKVNWIEGTAISIRETNADGTSQVKNYTTSIKGRGNSSWNSVKKPYALKLDKAAEVLGMKSHKRWCLLSNTFGWFFSNMIGYEMGRRAASADWAPSGKYVELILNGEHKGCYLLTEQIKIDKNRMNITKAGKNDIEGDAVTGGWLLEFDTTFDELFKFKSDLYQLPVMFKDPDDEIPDAQFNYLKDYINNLEASLKDDDRRNAREYMDYIDIDTFIDQWFIREMAGRDESFPSQHITDFKRPRSAWHYKDRGGKLKSGPVWDFDTYLYNDKVLICTSNCMYYGELFKESGFVHRVKEKWPDFRARLDGAGGKKDMVQYLDSLYATVKLAARRDRVLWPYPTHPATRGVDVQYEQLRVGIPDKLDWLGAQIAAMKVTYDNKTGGNEDFDSQQDAGNDFNFGF